MGLASVASSALALHRVEEADTRIASALLNTTQQIGGALGSAVLNSVYAATVAGYLAARSAAPAGADAGGRPQDLAAVAGYQQAFTVGAALMVLAAGTVAVLVTVRRSEFAAPAAPTPPPDPHPSTSRSEETTP